MTRLLLASSALLLLLTACQASLHALYPEGRDTADTGDTGGDSGDSGDSSDTSSSGSAPTLDSFSVSAVAGDLLVLFSASDADGDLEGGALEVTVNGTTGTYQIPSQLDSWTGSSGTLRITPSGGGSCSGGSNYNVTGAVTDAHGHRSGTGNDAITLGGTPVTVSEVGDTTADIDELGTLTAPVTLCGDAWGGANDDEAYIADYDLVHFYVGGSGGSWTFSLTWQQSGDDYDLHLFDWLGYWIDSSIQDGPAQPETITWTVYSGDEYYLSVGAWTGSGGPWTISIQ